MPTVADCLEHAKFLIERGRGDEPCQLVLPRVEAQRRKVNKEGKTRLVKDLHTAEAYKDWHTEFDRWVTICVDPNVAYKLMAEWLALPDAATIERLAKDDNAPNAT